MILSKPPSVWSKPSAEQVRANHWNGMKPDWHRSAGQEALGPVRLFWASWCCLGVRLPSSCSWNVEPAEEGKHVFGHITFTHSPLVPQPKSRRLLLYQLLQSSPHDGRISAYPRAHRSSQHWKHDWYRYLWISDQSRLSCTEGYFPTLARGWAPLTSEFLELWSCPVSIFALLLPGH
jgi:hypothetical protein